MSPEGNHELNAVDGMIQYQMSIHAVTTPAIRHLLSLSVRASSVTHFLKSALPILKSLGFDRVRAYLISSDREALVGLSEVGGGLNLLEGKSFSGLRLPISKSRYALATLQQSKTMIYSKAESSYPLGEDTWQALLGKEDLAQWIEVPLLKGRIPIGIICLDNKYSKTILTERRLQPLEPIFSFIGVTAARLKREAELLEAVTLIQHLSRIDLDMLNELKGPTDATHGILRHIFQDVSDHIMQFMSPRYVELALVNDSDVELLAYSGSITPLTNKIAFTEETRSLSMWRAIHEKREIITPGKDPSFLDTMGRIGHFSQDTLAILERVRVKAIFPVILDGKAKAITSIFSDDWDFFTASRIIALKDFHHKIALVMKVYRTLQQYNSEITELENRRDEIRSRLENQARALLTAEMARGVLHDFGNAISGMTLAVPPLKEAIDRGGKISERRVIRDSITTLENNATFIDQILDTYRKLGYEKEQVTSGDIHVVLTEAIGFIRARAERKAIRIKCRFSKQIPEFRFSYVGMLQVFVNLMNNAIQAMEKGGGGGRTLEIVTELSRGACSVRFTDQGTGVKPELTQKIFEFLFTTRAQVGGTGVGLAISRRIVEEHKGTLRLAWTQVGKGSTFEVRIPVIR